MVKDRRIFLYFSNIVVMISGFLLPIYITRSFPEYSDSIFFYLSLLNPLIIFFGFDQRKKIILGSGENYKFHTSVRLNFIIVLTVITSAFLVSFNSLYFFPVLLIKIISFSLDIHNGMLQNEKKFIRLFSLRIIELILVLILLTFNSSINLIWLIVYVTYLIFEWRPNFNSNTIEFIKKNYTLGLQGTFAAASSALGVYILKMTGNNDLITELAIQVTILSAVYMTQSIYLNSILDKFKEIGTKRTLKILSIINIVFILGGAFGFIFCHYIDLFKIVFNYKVSFSFLSIYAFVFMIIHMIKNSQFIYSFLINKEVIISKYKLLINILYIFPLFLPAKLEIKLLLVLIISFGEFIIVFKKIKNDIY